MVGVAPAIILSSIVLVETTNIISNRLPAESKPQLKIIPFPKFLKFLLKNSKRLAIIKFLKTGIHH